MKITAITIALMATLASAAPKPQCKPGTYACTTNSTGAPGWKVCNTSSKWVYAGDCPPDTVCKFYKPSLSPYCVPPNFEFPQ
ncbi:hypothetical protein CC79DRAFT_1363765 [Sarocladium strictum]